jgi:hypothetical protein
MSKHSMNSLLTRLSQNQESRFASLDAIADWAVTPEPDWPVEAKLRLLDVDTPFVALAAALGVPGDVARAVKVDPEFTKMLFPRVSGAALTPSAYYGFKKKLHDKATAEAADPEKDLSLPLQKYNEHLDRQVGNLQPLQAKLEIDNTFRVIVQQGEAVSSMFRRPLQAAIAETSSDPPIEAVFEPVKEAVLEPA